MNHSEYEKLLATYRDLGDAERAELERHTRECAQCAALLAAFQDIDRDLGRLENPQPSARLRQAVHAAAAGRPGRWPWGSLWRVAQMVGDAAGWVTVGIVTALLVLALAISGWPLARQARPADTPAPAGDVSWQIVRDELISTSYDWPMVEGPVPDRVPQLSPDGSKAAYLPMDSQLSVIDRLVVRDLATGKDRDLTPEKGCLYTNVRWSPDSRSLAFIKTRYEKEGTASRELWRIDADGRNLKLLSGPSPDSERANRPALEIDRWSADGQQILLAPWVGGPGDSKLARTHIDADGAAGGTVVVVTSALFGVNQDALAGEVIYPPSDDYALHMVKTAGLQEKPKGAPEDGYSLVLAEGPYGPRIILGSFLGPLYNISPSPDGQWIAFDAMTVPGEPTHTWVVKRDGSNLREISSQEVPGVGPIWAGNRQVLFHGVPQLSNGWGSALYSFDVESGQLARLWQGLGYQVVVSASRDGRRLLAIRSQGDKFELRWLDLAPRPALQVTPQARITPRLPGPGVADILAHPPAPGETVELDAYFSGADSLKIESIPPEPTSDQVVCPDIWDTALTDRPFLTALSVLNGLETNLLPEGGPWLIAVTPEMAKPGTYAWPQLPYHARLRGHLGDPAFAHCQHAARIFMVEEVVTVYEEKPPAAPVYRLSEDYAAWPRYHEASLGFSLPYPPGWQIERPDDVTWLLRDPRRPDCPVTVQVYDGEIYYDPYDPASVPPLLQGKGWSTFEQGLAFGGSSIPNSQHLAGYRVERAGPPNERTIAVLFSAHGHTYELSLRYPLGFAARQEPLTAYSAIVAGLQFDVPPGPTPTPPVQQELGPGPFLTRDEALAHLREGEEVELIAARLVPEAETRQASSPCATYTGHPEGVWLLTVRGRFAGQMRTMLFFIDATSGEQLCGEEINLQATPAPPTPAPTPTVTPVGP